MPYLYLLIAGLSASLAHFYLVWRHRDNRRYSVSEHAMLTPQSHLIYIVAHVVCEVFFLLFSYQVFLVVHHLTVAWWLNVAFAALDFVQALLPSRGKTEKLHFAAAYISWCCYLAAGIYALFALPVAGPYFALALAVLAPILGMYAYMHVNRSKLYPYQLAIVPLFVVFLLLVTAGAR
ncbi:MAG TPA: hypothetical protein VLF71_01110 [Candidatus Saccharimonadales bacterium]|nr:hypothetical protein [Candidatus Saccharimonadales bacterium]